MPRIPVFIYTADPATGNALPSVTCTVKNRITNTNVSLFSAETGGSSVTNPLTSDSLGRAFAWTERVPLKIDYSGAGITAYTEHRGDASQPTFESTLPASPYDGQEIYYQNATMATAGVVWHFRYRSGGGTYKWEYIGGPPLSSEVIAGETRATASYAALTTAGPSIAVPLAGIYDVYTSVSVNTSSASQVGAFMSYDIGGTAAVDADAAAAQVIAPGWGTTASSLRRKTLATAVTLTAKYNAKSGVSVGFGNREMTVTPVRVG